jgi:hypothetical protein
MECIRGIGPEYGWANFDNLGTAVLTVFTVIILQGWTEILYGDTPPLRACGCQRNHSGSGPCEP